jgi:hypothetical protein
MMRSAAAHAAERSAAAPAKAAAPEAARPGRVRLANEANCQNKPEQQKRQNCTERY